MLAFVLLGLVTGVAATDRSYSVGGISLDVTGNSGQIKLYTLADTSNFIQIKQSKLEEYDASGNSVNGHSVNLANSDFGWTPLSGYTQSDGTQYVSTTFQSSFTVGGNTGIFSLMCRLYRNATTVMTGSTSLTVVQNSVKFDINVTRWTFAATANTLQYEIEVASKGGDTGGSMNDRRGSGKRAVVFQNGLMDFPTTAVVDGVANTAITTALQIKSNGQKQVVQFNFPSFTRDLVYDPVMCIGCTADGSTGATVGSSAIAMAAAVVAAFALQRMA